MRRVLLALALVAVGGQATEVFSQGQGLRVTSAFPQGPLAVLQDANEVRIAFSAPMVEIGAPDTSVPPWITVEPAIPMNAYWSGTRTLILSPTDAKGFPYGTRVVVTVGAGARATDGRTLGTPYRTEFTTPTAMVTGTRFYRPTNRITDPIVLQVRFNQPMDPARTLRHLNSGPIAFRVAETWNEQQFPRDVAAVVLESTSAPAAGTVLDLSFDDQLTGAEGTVPHPQQRVRVTLEPVFNVQRVGCQPSDRRPCTGGDVPLQFTRPVRVADLRAALRVTDLTDPNSPTPVPLGPLPDRAAGREEFPTQYHSGTSVGLPEQPPASTWRIELADTLAATDGQTLSRPFTSTTTTIHAWPYVVLPGQVWESGAGTAVPYLSRNLTEVNERVVRLTAGEVMPQLIAMRMERTPQTPRVAPLVQRLAKAPDIDETVALDLKTAFQGAPTGLALVHLEPHSVYPGAPDQRTADIPTRATLVQVTNLGITAKHGPHGSLIFVTRLDSAAPVAGVVVSARDTTNTVRWTATTGADGIARGPALPGATNPNGQPPQWVLTAEKDGDTAWIASDWTPWRRGISPNLYGRTSAAILRGGLWTDRGAYQQGDTVKFKAMLRLDTPTGHTPIPTGTRIPIVLTDARGQEVASDTLDVNRWSSVEWSPRVPPGGSLGTYRVTVYEPAPDNVPRDQRMTVSTSFLVAAFRRPDFRVDVTNETKEPLLGRSVRARVDARFLFGASVGTRPVRWTVRRTPQRVIPKAITERFPEADYQFGYTKSFDEQQQMRTNEKTGRDQLAADGSFTVDVPIDDRDDSGGDVMVEGVVENTSGQVIANRVNVPWHPATFYIGLARPQTFVDATRPITTHIVAAALDGTPRAGVRTRVALLREDWAPQPNNSIEWRRTETLVREWTMTTTADRVPLEITVPGGGRFILRATADEAEGRRTRTDVAFYAYGGAPTRWRTQGREIDLVPEKETWEPGQQARILVQSPWSEALALVTTEREGVRSHRQVAIRSTQDTITVPITSADIPNVYVSVMLVKGRTGGQPSAIDADPGRPDYRLGYTMLRVDDAEKRLKVEVSADRDVYRPADPVAVTVQVRGADGRPRAGEVSLWAVDHGLLSLTGYTVPDVARQIYQDKSLQVSTTDGRERLIERRVITATTQGGAGGGRGGGVPGGFVGGVAGEIPAPMPAPPPLAQRVMVDAASAVVATKATVVGTNTNVDGDLRTDFRPVAFWVGSVTADASGTARTTASLPDSLTTYRIMAVAGTPDSHFGAADAEIRASKPLTLVPVFPRFMTVNTRASLGAVVTNGTNAMGTSEVSLSLVGSGVVELESAGTQTVRIDPGGSVPVRFDIRARDAGTARLRIRVRMGTETDAFEMPVPIHLPVAPITVAAYGDTSTGGRELIRVPEGLVPGRGGLTVSLASTALVGLGASALYLDEYPHLCAEPIASRAIVQLLSARLDNVFGMAGADGAAVRASGLRSLDELRSFQCPDGGFAMVNGGYSCFSAPYLTAYVLDVMRAAGALGGTLDTAVTDRAYSYLERQLSDRPVDVQWWPAWAATRAYIVKVLTDAGRPRARELTELVGLADRLPVYALSYVADALATSGDRGPRYQDIVRRITNATRIEADLAFIEERDEAALVWLWHSNVRATAVVLEGLSRRGDSGDLPPAMARWLLAQRRNARWDTTQENGVVLRALVAYADRFEAETPDMTVSTRVGTTDLGTTRFQGRSTTVTTLTTGLDALRAAGTSAPLTIERTGTGRAYYTTRLQYVPTALPSATARGLRLTREYFKVNDDGTTTAATSFANGDLVRVVIRLQLAHEGRYLAITDPLPAGFDPVDGAFQTTAVNEARVATTQSANSSFTAWWRRGGFDHVEKHDNRIVAFATRLSTGTHEITYLARAMTPGTFPTVGTLAEAIYAPEIMARTAATTVTVR